MGQSTTQFQSSIGNITSDGNSFKVSSSSSSFAVDGTRNGGGLVQEGAMNRVGRGVAVAGGNLEEGQSDEDNDGVDCTIPPQGVLPVVLVVVLLVVAVVVVVSSWSWNDVGNMAIPRGLIRSFHGSFNCTVASGGREDKEDTARLRDLCNDGDLSCTSSTTTLSSSGPSSHDAIGTN
jgi:hypothetical protein